MSTLELCSVPPCHTFGLLRELIGFVEHEETEMAICTSIRLYF